MTLLQRLGEARAVLRRATDLRAPKQVIDALCVWIGELEDHAIKCGLDPYEGLPPAGNPIPFSV